MSYLFTSYIKWKIKNRRKDIKCQRKLSKRKWKRQSCIFPIVWWYILANSENNCGTALGLENKRIRGDQGDDNIQYRQENNHAEKEQNNPMKKDENKNPTNNIPIKEQKNIVIITILTFFIWIIHWKRRKQSWTKFFL